STKHEQVPPRARPRTVLVRRARARARSTRTRTCTKHVSRLRLLRPSEGGAEADVATDGMVGSGPEGSPGDDGPGVEEVLELEEELDRGDERDARRDVQKDVVVGARELVRARVALARFLAHRPHVGRGDSHRE